MRRLYSSQPRIDDPSMLESVVPLAFKFFIAVHIAFGSIGLVSFWVPVVGRKGGANHRFWGRVFTRCMLVTGFAAVCISACTLIAPVETHPHVPAELRNPEWIRGIFGFMMMGLAILTINLAWYGWQCVENRQDHSRNLEWRNLSLQWLLLFAATVCAIDAIRIGQPVMLGMTAIGYATAITNLRFLYRARRGPSDWLKEHLKGLVGCGISVYTAFLAFGAVRTIPELALHPGLWAIPLVIGLAIILYHWWRIGRQDAARRPAAPAAT